MFVGLLICSGFLIAYIFSTIQDNQNKSAESSSQSATEATEASEPPQPEPVELPFGGRSLIPEYRFVALYGNRVHPGLGALGEQPLEEAITRARTVAAEYEAYSEEPVIPTFEIITTVAAAELTDDNDYSREISVETIRPWVDAAQEQGFYVLLDLQPGRSTFLSQAKKYEALLKEPHVGLALDPEWRLQTDTDRHLVKVGSVSAAEINETSQWLADLVKQHDLPQKMLVLHQFKPSMITERETLHTSREELAIVLHMDGHGALGSKTGTWNRIRTDLPDNIYMGWKNFYDEDRPTPTPQQTMAQIPTPWFISYQ